MSEDFNYAQNHLWLSKHLLYGETLIPHIHYLLGDWVIKYPIVLTMSKAEN